MWLFLFHKAISILGCHQKRVMSFFTTLFYYLDKGGERMVIYDIGSVVNWVSAFGTIGAVFLSVYLVFKESRTKFQIIVERKRQKDFGENYGYEIAISNMRARIVHIKSFGVYYREGLKKRQVSKMSDANSIILGSLAFGEMKTENFNLSKQQLLNLTGLSENKKRKYYIGAEDLGGKIHFERLHL